MTAAFCPAHTTCFFRPVHSGNILERGSKGVGIRLEAGTTVHMEEIRGRTKVTIDGKDDDAKITKHVLEQMAPGRSFDVSAECGLPPGQGFGMSASGAIAVALCVSEIIGKSRAEAFAAAHTSEVLCGGGLGDVAGLMHEADVPIRVKAGMPPFGQVTDRGIVLKKMTVVVLGEKMKTAAIIGNEKKLNAICDAGDAAMERFLGDPTKDALFEISNIFSDKAEVKGLKVADAIRRLERNGIRSAMCMLGNSIFTDVPEEEVRAVLGDVRTFSTSSASEPARIIRKG